MSSRLSYPLLAHRLPLMKTILLISPYWKEDHRWMVSSYKLAELWQRIGFRVIVACMGAETSVERVSDTLEIHRFKDVFLPDPWNYGIAWGFSRNVARIVRSAKPDHVVVNKVLFWTSISTLRLRWMGVPVTLLTDALVGMTWFPRGRIPGIAARIYAWTLGWLILRAAHRVVFFFPQPERLLRRLGIYDKSQVIPTGIDPVEWSVARDQGSETIMVTYVGRLESIKGVDDFLAALTPLKRQFSNVKLQVVGWYTDDHPLVKEYERDVIFTGLRKDIPEVLSASDLFVMPSHSEGLSNALMEAMASGCACVASDVGGNRYLLQNGVSGLLFPAGDREALAAHVRRLLEDPAKRRAIGEAARKRIHEHFSWDVVGKMYQALFREREQ